MALLKNPAEEVHQQQANMKEDSLSNKHFREQAEIKPQTHGGSSGQLFTISHDLVTPIFCYRIINVPF